MKRILTSLILNWIALLGLGILSSCKNDNPSILKIFVRSESSELLENAQVVIIGDPSSNPPTTAYVDTLFSNSSGYAEFNMEPYFSVAGEDNSTAYFDVIAKYNSKKGTSYVRCRKHVTAVETIYLTD
jgi:hypothetical protein